VLVGVHVVGKVTTSKTRSSLAEELVKNDTYTSLHIEEFDV